MPLAPDNVVSAWYSRQSWVYHAFSYLFANPLWTTKVPNGFSLCGFFWLALLSLTLFRPFVYLVLGLRGLARALHIVPVIKWIDSIWGENTPMGIGTMMLICMTTSASFVLYLSYVLITNLNELGLLTVGLPVLVSMISFATCGLYYEHTEHDTNRCRVEIYNRVIIGLCLLAPAIFHPSIFFGTFVGLPVAGLGYVWAALVWVVKGAWWLATYVGWGIVLGVSYIWVGIAALIVLGCYGWVMAKLAGGSYGATTVAAPRVKPNKGQIADNLFVIANATHEAQFNDRYSWSDIRGVVANVYEAVQLARSKMELTEQDVPSEVINAVLDYLAAHQRRAASRSALCKAWTEGLAKACAPIVWCYKQGRILGSYLWQFTKAKKQGVCPYLPFTD